MTCICVSSSETNLPALWDVLAEHPTLYTLCTLTLLLLLSFGGGDPRRCSWCGKEGKGAGCRQGIELNRVFATEGVCLGVMGLLDKRAV